jgi:hypothetical protein
MGAISQWLPLINSELARGSYPFPPELITSIIRYESRGIAGKINEKSGASGLMQVIAITLKDYNRRTGSNISMATLRSKSTEAARLQIRVGLNVLGRYWWMAGRWLRSINGPKSQLPIADLARFASAFYVAGPNRIMPMAPKVKPMTWAVWERAFPKANSTVYCNRIWKRTAEKNPNWNTSAIEKWIGNKPPVDTPPPLIADKDPVDGLLIGLMVILFGMWIMTSMGGKRSKANDIA